MKYADSDNAQLCLGFSRKRLQMIQWFGYWPDFRVRPSNRKLSTASKNVVNNPVPLTLKYIKHPLNGWEARKTFKSYQWSHRTFEAPQESAWWSRFSQQKNTENLQYGLLIDIGF